MILGLTGGIACGKSTVSRIVKDRGIPVWDADHETHKLYKSDLETIAHVSFHFPEVVTKNNVVDRRLLGNIVLSDPVALATLTSKVNERLRASLQIFLADVILRLAVLDVPLLYEAGLEKFCDRVMVVHCRPETQRARALARAMSEERLDHILSLQMMREERNALGDYLIDTDQPLDQTRAEVERIIALHLQENI